MSEAGQPIAVTAAAVPLRSKASLFPEPYASRMNGRQKRALGEFFGLTHFGVNLARLAPGAVSSLRHTHSRQDEMVYIVHGRPTLHTNEGRTQLAPGMCAGFKAGNGNAHRLLNETDDEVVYLEIGDRGVPDAVSYPDDDLEARPNDGQRLFFHKDGSAYP